MSKGQKFPLAQATASAESLARALAEHLKMSNVVVRSAPGEMVLTVGYENEKVPRIVFCGSLRRKKVLVGDLDLVVCAMIEDEFRKALAILVKPESVIIRKYDKAVNGIFWPCGDGEMKVEFTLAAPLSWGAALMYRTGSHILNVRQRSMAKAQGLLLNEKGLWDRDTGGYITGETEKEVFDALGMDFLSPTRRNIE